MMSFLAALSGLLLALAFPKFNLFWLAWIALVPLFFVLQETKNLKAKIFYGFVFGLVFFLVQLFWVTTLFRFAGFWVYLGWLSLALYQVVFTLLFVVLLHFLAQAKKIPFPFLAAICWVFIEWLRNVGFIGGVTAEIGYSQAPFFVLIQIADVAAVYGVSFLVVLFNASLVEFIRRKRWPMLLIAVLLAAGACGYGFYRLGQSSDFVACKPLTVSLIQPNVDQKDKLDSQKVPEIFAIHEQMSRQAAQDHPEIIVWPETAIFSYVLHNAKLRPRLQQIAKDSNAWLVIGTPHYENGKPYNSIISMSPQGEVIARYDKQHLVPFGEYLPFRTLLFPILKNIGYYDADYTANPQAELVYAADFRIAPAICFESTFPGLVKSMVSQGADFILTVTNDGWFADSAALYSHLNAGVFRAIENRKYFIQVGNTGFTMVIDPLGRVLKKLPINKRGILTLKIPLSQDSGRVIVD
ncbi:MAG: apolipoprotein N-acyltransferase [bacterium]